MIVVTIQITATLYILTLCFNNIVISQRIISTQPNELHNLCPGQEVTITCETRGSETIAWSSDEYIGRAAHLEFSSSEIVGVTKRAWSSNIVATLANNTNENGVTVLVSQLHIIALPGALTSSVTCIHIANGITITITVHVLGMFHLLILGWLRPYL